MTTTKSFLETYIELHDDNKAVVCASLKKYEVSKEWKEVLKQLDSAIKTAEVTVISTISPTYEPKIVYSDITKDMIQHTIYKSLVELIDGKLEGGKIVKGHMLEQVDLLEKFASSKLMHKEHGYPLDTPVYSELDGVKFSIQYLYACKDVVAHLASMVEPVAETDIKDGAIGEEDKWPLED